MEDFRLEGADRRRRNDFWGCDRIDCSGRRRCFDGFEAVDELGADREGEPTLEGGGGDEK